MSPFSNEYHYYKHLQRKTAKPKLSTLITSCFYSAKRWDTSDKFILSHPYRARGRLDLGQLQLLPGPSNLFHESFLAWTLIILLNEPGMTVKLKVSLKILCGSSGSLRSGPRTKCHSRPDPDYDAITMFADATIQWHRLLGRAIMSWAAEELVGWCGVVGFY